MDGKQPLHFASYSRDSKFLSPLEAACTYFCPMHIFIYLANQVLNLSTQNKLGKNLLKIATSACQVDQVSYLISKGVVLNVQDFQRKTAFDVAVRKKSGEIVALLLDAGASTSNLPTSGNSVQQHD